MEVFKDIGEYLASLPKDKAMVIQGYRKNPQGGYYKLIKAKDVIRSREAETKRDIPRG